MEIYNDLDHMGVMVRKGRYGFSKADSAVVKVGPYFGVYLDTSKIKTTADELDAASHEWSHIKGDATYGIDAPPEVVMKAETLADRIQIERILPFEELQTAMRNGCTTPYELAERLSVTEKMILRAYNYYTGPKGLKFA